MIAPAERPPITPQQSRRYEAKRVERSRLQSYKLRSDEKYSVGELFLKDWLMFSTIRSRLFL